MSKEKRETGSVKWFDPDLGYGFIERDNNAGEIFVHRDGIREGSPAETLQEGDRVEFVIVQGNKGARAEDVDLLIG